MALEQQIQKDIMEAMKAHNTIRTMQYAQSNPKFSSQRHQEPEQK